MSSAPNIQSDIQAGDWIDRHVPAGWRPYARLARLDRPIGTWLLLFPCWWSIALAAEPDHWPDLWLMALFGIGALVMRGAGCTVNDIIDRDIDAKVARTAARPLASGRLSLTQAFAFLGLQLAIGLVILLQLSATAIWLGVASLILVAVYPFMKRITWWPQAFLGLTFNWGALVGWAAVRDEFAWPPVLLYAAGFFWTLSYDTIYAHQDKEDDTLIGVKSTALLLGKNTKAWLLRFDAALLVLLVAAGAYTGMAWIYYAAVLGIAAHLKWQEADVNLDNAKDCLAKFHSNRVIGWILLAGIVLGRLWS
ncbi:MAG TPA: 4-hydroxybenzoate octaprenyltransferase [Dongiaceae bacterium]|nr:4-hydroxybenzoate octaprenyltransferase [Dongiaceae bacterium]